MFSTKMKEAASNATSEPSNDNRGMKSRMPAINLTLPVKCLKAGDEPICDQSTPMSENCPNGSTKRVRLGNGICSGMTFNMPYPIIVAPTASRTNTVQPPVQPLVGGPCAIDHRPDNGYTDRDGQEGRRQGEIEWLVTALLLKITSGVAK